MKHLSLLTILLGFCALSSASYYCRSPRIPNGRFEVQSESARHYIPRLSVGTVIIIFCNHGYDLVGDSVITCFDYGWAPKLPICKKTRYCPQPPMIDHGSFSVIQGKYAYPDTVEYKCNAGFYLDGKSKFTCTKVGSWYPKPFPQCKAKCTARRPPVNGGVKPQQQFYRPGDDISFYCNRGFILKGASKDYCQNNGKWKNDTPKCIKLCYVGKINLNPHLSYFPMKKAYYPGDDITFKCKRPFFLVGDSTLECQLDGNWDGAFPGCVRRCSPPDIDNGGVVDEQTYYSAGAYIKYFCNKGYSLTFATWGRCLANGEWSAVGVCKPVIKKCRQHTIKNGGLDPKQDWYNAHDTIDYYCNDGYQLKGKYFSNRCRSNGKWAHPYPMCEEVPSPGSCKDRCGQVDYFSFSCQCDYKCMKRNACCKDFMRSCNGGYFPLYALD